MLKHRSIRTTLATGLFLVFQASTLFAQTTAFNYQGVLIFEGKPITGYYDFLFDLYSAETGGSHSGTLVSLPAIPVVEGKFLAILDFGTSAFDGSTRWIEVAVRTNGSGNYSYLSPRQPVLSVPYAVQAKTAQSAQTATSAQTAQSAQTAVSAQTSTTAQTATTAGSNAVSTASIQNGAVTASKIATGQVVKSLNGLADAVTIQGGQNITVTPSGNSLEIAATNVWGTAGNTINNAYGYLGTKDSQSLNIGVGGLPALTLDPQGFSGTAGKSLVTLRGNASLADHVLWLRANNTNSSLGWYGSLDGPVLYGGHGGGLGTLTTTPTLALQWDVESLRLRTNTWLEGHDLYLGSFGDQLNWAVGLGAYDHTHDKPFGNIPMRGPVLYGYNEGGLGTTAGTRGISLRWNDSGQVSIPGELHVTGGTWLENNDLFLQGQGNDGSGLGYYGESSLTTPKLFGKESIDGPVLYGFRDGALGTKSDHKLALKWDNRGDKPAVTIPGDLLLTGTGWLENNDLYFRTKEFNDHANGLGWYGYTQMSTPKKFGTNELEGPVLYGWRKGGLGTTDGGTNLAVIWNNSGHVDIPGELSAKNMPALGGGSSIDKKWDGFGDMDLLTVEFTPQSSGSLLIVATAQVDFEGTSFALKLKRAGAQDSDATESRIGAQTGPLGPSGGGVITLLRRESVQPGPYVYTLSGSVSLGVATVSKVNIYALYFPQELEAKVEYK